MNVNESMVRLLTSPALAEAGTLLGEMTRLEAIHTEVVLLVMRHGLEANTCVQWMLFCFTQIHRPSFRN